MIKKPASAAAVEQPPSTPAAARAASDARSLHVGNLHSAATRDMLLAMIQNLAADEEKQSREERRMPSTRQISSLLDRARTPAKTTAESKPRAVSKRG